MTTETLPATSRRLSANERIGAASKRIMKMRSDDSTSALWQLVGALQVMARNPAIRSRELAELFERVSGAEEHTR